MASKIFARTLTSTVGFWSEISGALGGSQDQFGHRISTAKVTQMKVRLYDDSRRFLETHNLKRAKASLMDLRKA